MAIGSARVDEAPLIRDRQWAIVREVEQRQRVSVTELSQLFGVSEVMIRRDLERLDSLGLVRRVHGGAEAVLRSSQPIVFSMRLLRNQAIKRALGSAAAPLANGCNSIFLDSGTTVLEVAHHLPEVLPETCTVTVATRSLLVASSMRLQRNVRLYVLGGIYQPDYDAFVGSQAESALEGLRVDTLFMGADGITVERGVSTDNIQEANMYRAMARCAHRVVVVADASKLGVHTLQAVLPCEEIDVLVTDARAPADLLQGFRDRGVEVVVAPIPGDALAGREKEGESEDPPTSP